MANWTRKEIRDYNPVDSLRLEALYQHYDLPKADPEARRQFLQAFTEVPRDRQSEYVMDMFRGRRGQALNILESAALDELNRMGGDSGLELYVALYRNNTEKARSAVKRIVDDVSDLMRVKQAGIQYHGAA
ncbi:hypothetical protein KY363_07580 [Candidatus Woesearchaeota archaeon]|nr:hypothetical protein [Candidatus Woesearchaeota archaeon]